MNRHTNGRYRIDYFQKLLPVSIMIWTAVAGLGFKTSSYIVQAREGANNASWVDTANTTPSPTPQLTVVKPTLMPTATPVPSTKQQIFEYIVYKFGDDAGDFITMIRKCENSTFDQTRTNHNRNGTVDYGVAQINSIHIPRCGEALKTDWKANIDCAYDVYERAGKTFRPWTCAYEIGQKNYLQ